MPEKHGPHSVTAPDAMQKRFEPATEKRTENPMPRGLAKCFSLEDMEEAARRRLPVPIFGYVSGWAETGATARANRRQFDDWRFLPQSLAGHARRDLSRTMMGERVELPFAIAPMGFSALAAYDGDVALARAAAHAGTFAVMSATSLTPLERFARQTGGRWFQAYFPGDSERVVAMVDRIAAAGFTTLVVTIDIPVNGNREIDRRNGFVTPLKPSLRLALQGAARPYWLLGTAVRTLTTRGMPHFENLDVDRGPPILARDIVRSFSRRETLAWEHVRAARDRWKGRFVLKGVLTAEDTQKAREIGADGVIVSNHGGRQLDGAVPPLQALPAVKAAAGDMAVMIDSGFRRGTDVLKAIALGADFVFVGRPFLYAAACGGEEGVRHAIDMLKSEIDRDMSLLGIRDLDEMTRSRIVAANVVAMDDATT